ncbi:ABC transporter ATP-binding protein [Terrilactibacillus laevilacticus]|uniref:ABC transporter ATP-binding protein n=1 Tax=Terrilactibacillus laevilacticus TaxID=1380157 RepID=A0ABW5PPE3_9BACI|nr:ABC transporter ATP-binding protein [Terrilactibacillus laevilacticus]
MLKQFISYYKPYKALFILDFSCAVIAALLELAFPVAVNQFIDQLLPSRNWSWIMLAVLGLLFFYSLNTAMQFVVNYWGHMLGINIETTMRKQLFEHIQKQSFSFFDNHKTGHLLSRLTNDLFDIGEVAHHGPEDVFIAVMSLFGSFVLMLTINWKLACLSFVLVPILTILIVFFNKKMTHATTRIYKDIAAFNAIVENAVGGIRVVQAFSNEAYENEQFKKNNTRYRLAKLLSYKILGANNTFNYFLMRLITLFTLVCGAYFTIKGEITDGQFVSFLLLTNIFIRPIEKINAVIELYPKGIAGFKRFMELMQTKPEIMDLPHAIDVDHVDGHIIYQDVSFGYEGKKDILNHINLEINPGETIAFVGPSGAGKTTICNLLPRFYDIKSGEILIDGLSIRDMTLSSLRQHIGIVQQDVFLFSGTLRENIAYGKLDATDEEIWHVVRLARLEETVKAMSDGLDTVIGERGVKLSGGQKQRLSIARMFLKNPSILILDEATSALDTATEMAIQQSLEELSEGRTTLVIAHRLATIKHADRIIVVTEEGIVEQGSHTELINKGGVYSGLHQAQFQMS